MPHRRHHHDEVVRHVDVGPARAAPGQGPAPPDRPAVRAVVGDRQPPARPADTAEGRAPRGGGGQGRRAREGGGSGQDAGRQARRRRRVILEPIAFWGLAVVLLASALAVVLTRNLFHSVLYLALML